MNRGEGMRPAQRVASLDIGTNSLRLLVADVEADGGFRKVFEDRRIVRLGQGVQGSGSLSDGAIGRTVESLRAFLGEARARGASRTLAAATSAVREARNGEPFVRRVREALGLEVRVLSGPEEARWMVLGVSLLWRDPPGRWLAVDMGGGSTELAAAAGRVVQRAVSLPLGMVRLTEELLGAGPAGPGELERCRGRCRELLERGSGELLDAGRGVGLLVGTAGTVTTLAALDMEMASYDAGCVNGYRLSRDAVSRWVSILAKLGASQRRGLRGMEPGREDVILAGAVMVEELLRMARVDEMVVSDYGLLEGIALMAAGPASGSRSDPGRGGGVHAAG
jgi:exopolyphosphatase/guanosine-5'-triphosphate,3'-diphosphate pyrophosphatase